MAMNEAAMPQEQQGPADGGGGGAAKLIGAVVEGMGKVVDILGKSGIAPEALEKVSAAAEAFQGAIQEAIQGGGEQQAAAPRMVSPEGGVSGQPV